MEFKNATMNLKAASSICALNEDIKLAKKMPTNKFTVDIDLMKRFIPVVKEIGVTNNVDSSKFAIYGKDTNTFVTLISLDKE
jgi:hypothetical protein